METKKSKGLMFVAMMFAFSMLISGKGYALAADGIIPNGVTIGGVELGGKTAEEAKAAANESLSEKMNKKFVLHMDENSAEATASELGYYWKNTEVVDEAAKFCSEGNVIKRYKESKDIAHSGVRYDFELDVNSEVLTNTINEKCGVFNIPHVNAALKKNGDAFTISKESSGRMIDMETSVGGLYDYLMNKWDGNDAEFTLTVVDDNPVATVADCEKVKDLIGTYSTTFSTGGSNYNRNKNMENGIYLLNGITICQGDTISVNSFLEPWTASNGWKMAGTYVNGRVENSLGGGICQVSTTLYNAVLNAELEVVERFPHSMSVGYVPLSMDAALAGTWKDLKVRNNTDTPVYIEGIYSAGKITFNIYGVETRPANRRVEYVSETLSKVPSREVVTNNPSLPSGYRQVTSSGHTGYKARLLKRVYIDGVLQSEEVVNTSNYAASPTYVTVGTGAAAPAEPETPGQPGGTDTPGQSGGTDTPGQLGGTDTPGQSGGTDTPGQSGGTDTPGQSGETETPGQSGGTDTPSQSGGTDTPSQGGETEPPADNTL